MRLIDPEQLKKDIRCSFSSDADAILISQFINDYAVPVDAEPIRHGHWIHKFGYNGERHTVCSACGRDRRGHFSFDFCMDCGAKMDEEEQ